MRPEDFRDYFKLHRFVANPWQVVRFRKTQTLGTALSVLLRDAPALHLRGGLPDHHMFHRIYLRDEYRLDPFDHPDRDWQCVVDLGANTGIFSARAAAFSNRVIAYEPIEENFRQLERNLRGRENVIFIRGAVAGESGPLRIYQPIEKTRTGAFSAHAKGGGFLSDRFEEVTAITLDELFERHQIEVCNLLKIDVEGEEYSVLDAAGDETLAKIERIHGEYHDVDRSDPRTRIQNFSRSLSSKGFDVVVLPHERKTNHGMFFATRHPGSASTTSIPSAASRFGEVVSRDRQRRR